MRRVDELITDGVVRPLREAALERLAERERLVAGPACSIETRSLPRLATCRLRLWRGRGGCFRS